MGDWPALLIGVLLGIGSTLISAWVLVSNDYIRVGIGPGRPKG
jgi:hypothetical protein